MYHPGVNLWWGSSGQRTHQSWRGFFQFHPHHGCICVTTLGIQPTADWPRPPYLPYLCYRSCRISRFFSYSVNDLHSQLRGRAVQPLRLLISRSASTYRSTFYYLIVPVMRRIILAIFIWLAHLSRLTFAYSAGDLRARDALPMPISVPPSQDLWVVMFCYHLDE